MHQNFRDDVDGIRLLSELIPHCPRIERAGWARVGADHGPGSMTGGVLSLYCLPTRGELMTVTSLSFAANVPQTSGLRWQQRLTDEGLIERGPHAVDLRKQMIRLTTEGRKLMDRYLTHLFYCDTAIPEQGDRAG